MYWMFVYFLTQNLKFTVYNISSHSALDKYCNNLIRKWICLICIKGTVSRVAHARLSASRSTHAVISRHYRYGFVGNLKYTWATLRNFWIRNRKIECFSVKESQSEGCECKRSCSTRRKSTSNGGCLCERPTVKCTVETFVDMAEKTSRARTG